MSNALTPPAIPAGLTAGPPPSAAPAATPPVPIAPAPAAEAVAAPPADPRGAIDTIAKQFGYEPAQFAAFSDVESAKAAIRMAAETTAQEGFRGPAAPITPVAPAPAAAAPPAYYSQPTAPIAATAPARAPAIDLKALGIEDDEPIAKAFRVMEYRLGNAEQRAADADAKAEAQQQAQIQQNRQVLRAQAAQVVDSFADPTYGTSTARSTAQAYNLSRLYDLADAILIGAANRGQQAPPLSVRLAQARLIDETPSIAAPGANPTPSAATFGALPSAAPPSLGSAPKMGMTDKWSQNLELMAQLR